MEKSFYSFYFNLDEYKALSEKQRKLFISAITLFANNGYGNTSTLSISKHANVSEGLLYKTFRNKENLLKLIIKPFISKITPPKLLDENSVSLSNFIQQYYTEKIEFINMYEPVVKILIRELAYNPKLISIYKISLSEGFWDITNKNLDSLKNRHLIANWENKYLFRTLNSALINYLLRNYLYETEFDSVRINYTIKATVKALSPE